MFRWHGNIWGVYIHSYVVCIRTCIRVFEVCCVSVVLVHARVRVGIQRQCIAAYLRDLHGLAHLFVPLSRIAFVAGPEFGLANI